MKRKIFSIFFALVLVCSFSLVTAVPAGAVEPETVVLGGDVATAVNAQGSSDDYHLGSGSWQSALEGKVCFYAPIDSLGEFTIAEIASISYWTNKPGAQGDPDFYLAIYTTQDDIDDGSWYGYRLNAEPLYSNGLDAPANDWNQWSTGGATNQLTFFDFPTTVEGFYNGPTLVDLQAGDIDWASYLTSGSTEVIDYGPETVMCISFQTGSGWDPPFDGYLDDITITLKDGPSVTIDLEQYYAEVWVDDDATQAWYDLPGNFATIQEGINVVAESGTVNVAAGDYDELLTINKGLTLLGANAGIHPAVGTHPTESVGTRVDEAILSHDGFYAIQPQADDITVAGFKFTGDGGRLIDTYKDANNFHLTNCIFVNPLPHNNNLIQLAGANSYTDVLIDFNLFQDLGIGTLYFQGTCDRLRIAYNKFNGLGDGVFWAAEPLVDGIIEGNEFDGTISGTPGVGGTGLNISQGGNIIIRNNWFHDMSYTGFQVGIIGGSVTGNTFEDTYPLLWGGDWYASSAFELWGSEYGPASTDVTISGNTIKFNDRSTVDADEHGIRLRPGADAPNIHINSNDFIDGDVSTTALAVRNQGTGIVDAEKNWWDDATGPYHITNPDGLGGAVSDDVDFSPWFGDPVGTDPMTIVVLVTGTDPSTVPINGIATVGISGGNAAQGTIGGTGGLPDPPPPTTLFIGTGKTGVLFLDVYVTGYTSGIAHITVDYPDDTPEDGFVDDTDPPIVETTLGLYYWDDAAFPPMWRIAANNTVNTTLNTVSGDIPVVALTGTPLGGGGYPEDEATVAIENIADLSFSGNDTVDLTIDTQTAQLGAATIDITFDNTVVEVLGGENSQFDSLTVNPAFGLQTARFVANQLGPVGVDATGGAVLAQVRLKAVGNTGSSSPLTVTVITLKDNDGIDIPVGAVNNGTATIGGLGDANSDGVVDVYDCVYIARAIAGIPGYIINLDVMDVDGSGGVDPFDCTYLARHIAGIPGYEQLGG